MESLLHIVDNLNNHEIGVIFGVDLKMPIFPAYLFVIERHDF